MAVSARAKEAQAIADETGFVDVNTRATAAGRRQAMADLADILETEAKLLRRMR